MDSEFEVAQVTGIFGGSFDPVHLGHVRIAEALIRRELVEQVIFIPAAQAPHKMGHATVGAEHRLAMLRLAVSGKPGLRVSDYEIRQGGVSYTIHTLEHFHRIFGSRLRMIVGMDSLVDLHKWYRSHDLVRMCPIITYRRPGTPDPGFSDMAGQFGDDCARRLLANIVDAEQFETSSTQIRQRCHSGKSLDDLLAPEVSRYIVENKLYT